MISEILSEDWRRVRVSSACERRCWISEWGCAALENSAYPSPLGIDFTRFYKLEHFYDAFRQSTAGIHHRIIQRQCEICRWGHGAEVRYAISIFSWLFWFRKISILVLRIACDVFSSLRRQLSQLIGCSLSRTPQCLLTNSSVSLLPRFFPICLR